ncbi:MAG: AAA family ATPase, partial [Verrucomicrobiota bacterium]
MADLEGLKKAVAVSPDNAPLIVMLAQAYLENFSPDEAREQFERALELEPQNVDAKLGLIETIEQTGKISEAIVRAEGLCTAEPKNARAKMLMARLLVSDGEGKQAREFYDAAIALAPTLENPDLLKRIKEAGGSEPSAAAGPPPQKTPIAAAGGWGATASYDLGMDDDDEIDPNEELRLDFLQKSDIGFDDVGGMENVKKEVRMKILLPLQNRELFEAYGKKAGGGVLLYGPPGCGKTLISKATAGEIEANFFSIGLHQVLEMFTGESEKKLHEIFELARSTKPAVLFFDEIDALAADRRDLRGSHARTLINQFLAEMDGSVSDNDDLLVLGATNAPWHLDSAFLRPGRFDRLIFVPPPDEGARAEILKVMAKDKPIADLDIEGLVK